MNNPFTAICAAIVLASALPAAAHAALALTPGQPIAVSSTAASFDYMTVDPGENRLYASHPRAQSLTVVDLTTNAAREIPLGTEVNGVAYDAQDQKFFTAGGGGKLFAFSRNRLDPKDTVNLDGPGDGILFDDENDTLYVDNDDGTKIWAFDGNSDKLVATITIDGAPEYMQYDPATKRLFQNIKPANEVQVIDTTTNSVVATWPTAPATSPHGLVFDPKTNRLYSAGRNDTLAIMDAATGKVIATTPLASGVDQIAFDPKLRRIYCPGGGFMTIVSLTQAGDVASSEHMAIPAGAHTIAVDPKTDNVWICYPDKIRGKSYVQPFMPDSSATAAP